MKVNGKKQRCISNRVRRSLCRLCAADYGIGTGGRGYRFRRLGDDVGQELVLKDGDLILEDKFAFLQSLNVKLVERWRFRNSRDGFVKVPVF